MGVSATRPAMIWSALLIVYIVWGSTYLAIRVVVETMPPMVSAGTRFGLAAVLLAAILRVRHGRGALRVTRRQLAGAALVGVLLLTGGNGLVMLAESGPPGVAVPSGIAALLVAVVPLLVVLLRLAVGDRPRSTTVAGVLVGLGGLVVLVAPTGGAAAAAPLAGALLVLAAATSWSTGSFISSRISMPSDAFVATVYQMAAGAAALLAIGALRGELRGFDVTQVSARSWSALVYLLVAGSLIAFTAYVWLLQNAPISLVATYAYVNPAVAVALGALFVAEPITPRVLLGGLVIVVGVALVVTTERPRRGRS
ncbi:EamA family transporter [Micromonospora sp. NBC_01813]|uniref:EamA family transporter n=1 Tax=Micromonospora sp. NBC_01813 TaxID=2975988 RepID=UPI002DDA0B0A|nr:EamA family transporter [Micromonospora sp. NBC_01813]WSA07594.1 EamA family transporter [Micromonospora sp. NBC_01813]